MTRLFLAALALFLLVAGVAQAATPFQHRGGPNGAASYVGPCDVSGVTCAEAWGLTRKMKASYNGNAFQLYAFAGPNTGATHDVGFGSNGLVDTSGLVGSGAFCGTSAGNCVYLKIYAQIHPGSNDVVSVPFHGQNGPFCDSTMANCACVFELNATTGLPMIDFGPGSPISGRNCQYAIISGGNDATATGILGTPANDLAGVAVGFMNWTNPSPGDAAISVSHIGTGTYTYGTLFSFGYVIGNGFGYEFCTSSTIYCASVDLEQPSGLYPSCADNPCGGPYTGNSGTSTTPGHIISQVSYNHTTGLMSGYSNGHQAWAPQTVGNGSFFFNVPTPPYIHLGAGGDMTPQYFQFYEGFVTNTDITSNAAAIVANVTSSPAYAGITFP